MVFAATDIGFRSFSIWLATRCGLAAQLACSQDSRKYQCDATHTADSRMLLYFELVYRMLVLLKWPHNKAHTSTLTERSLLGRSGYSAVLAADTCGSGARRPKAFREPQVSVTQWTKTNLWMYMDVS